MATRALIVAIGSYPACTELSDSLPGVVEGATLFYDWLIGDAGLDPANVLGCTEHDVPWRTHATGRPDIIEAIKDLVRRGADETETLFVYLGGHGFAYRPHPREHSVTLLLTAEFSELSNGGSACIDVDELQRRLDYVLGPKEHYYFVDTCRPVLTPDELEPSTLGMAFPPSELGRPIVHTLYSTREGATAPADATFATALVNALRGRGRSTSRDRDHVYVTLERVAESLARTLPTHQIEYRHEGYCAGITPGRIHRLASAPEVSCSIRVEGARQNDLFHLTLSLPHGPGFERTKAFTGPTCTLRLPVDDYRMVLKRGDELARRLEPVDDPAEIYEDCRLAFQLDEGGDSRSMSDGELVLPDLPDTVSLRLCSADHAKREVTVTAERLRRTNRSVSLVPGAYSLIVLEHGREVGRSTVTVAAGTRTTPQLREARRGTVDERLRASIDAPRTSDGANASDTLTLLEEDLGLWLAVLASSHVLGRAQDGSSPFDGGVLNANSGNAPIILIVSDDGKPKAALEGCPEQPLIVVNAFNNVYHSTLPTTPGSQLLSLRLAGSRRWLSTHTCPGRATIVVAVPDEQGRTRVYQLMLPMASARDLLAPADARLLNAVTDPLRAVCTMVRAQRRFLARQEMFPESSERDIFERLERGEWLDPLFAIVFAYDRIRRGDTARLAKLVAELRSAHVGIPDVEILAAALKLGDLTPAERNPLVLDGWLLTNQSGHRLPPPPGRLDFRGAWLCWREARSATNRQAPKPEGEYGAVIAAFMEFPRIQGYEVLHEVGEGGQARVYRGREQAPGGRPVAIKCWRAPGLSTTDLDLIEREAEALRRATHPNLVRFVAMVTDHRSYPCLIMDFVDGLTLADLVTTAGRLPHDQVARFGVKLSRALAHLHELALIHRDVKPKNVVVRREDGEPILVDLGIVKFSAVGESNSAGRATGRGLGTYPYMAPEQLGPEVQGQAEAHLAVDHRVDIYGLGALLFECVTGCAPWTDQGPWTRMNRDVWRDPVHRIVLRRAQDVPRSLQAIIARCMAGLPDQRYRDAGDLTNALSRYEEGQAPGPGLPLNSARVMSVLSTELIGLRPFHDARPHQRLVRRLLSEEDGFVITENGNTFCLSFSRPTAAVTFGLRLLLECANDQSLPSVRTGIHFGEITERSDLTTHGGSDVQVEGPAVEVAQALCLLAGENQVLVSRSVADDVRQRVVEVRGAPVEWISSHGEYALRVAEQERLVEVCEVGFPSVSPLGPPRESDTARRVPRLRATLVAHVAPDEAVALVQASVSGDAELARTGSTLAVPFNTPTAAIRAGLGLLKRHDQPGTVRLRLGVHLDEAADHWVSRRLCELAGEGQLLTSASVAELARRGLAGEMIVGDARWTRHGAYLLEGTDAAHQLRLEVVQAGLARSPTTVPLDRDGARRDEGMSIRLVALTRLGSSSDVERRTDARILSQRLEGPLAAAGGRDATINYDNIRATFASSTAAVRFGVRLLAGGLDVPHLPNLCIGIHMAEETDQGANDVASLLASLANPGQLLLGQPSLEQARTALGTRIEGQEVSWHEHDTYLLKVAGRPSLHLRVGQVALSKSDTTLRLPEANEQIEQLPHQHAVLVGGVGNAGPSLAEAAQRAGGVASVVTGDQLFVSFPAPAPAVAFALAALRRGDLLKAGLTLGSVRPRPTVPPHGAWVHAEILAAIAPPGSLLGTGEVRGGATHGWRSRGHYELGVGAAASRSELWEARHAGPLVPLAPHRNVRRVTLRPTGWRFFLWVLAASTLVTLVTWCTLRLLGLNELVLVDLFNRGWPRPQFREVTVVDADQDELAMLADQLLLLGADGPRGLAIHSNEHPDQELRAALLAGAARTGANTTTIIVPSAWREDFEQDVSGRLPWRLRFRNTKLQWPSAGDVRTAIAYVGTSTELGFAAAMVDLLDRAERDTRGLRITGRNGAMRMIPLGAGSTPDEFHYWIDFAAGASEKGDAHRDTILVVRGASLAENLAPDRGAEYRTRFVKDRVLLMGSVSASNSVRVPALSPSDVPEILVHAQAARSLMSRAVYPLHDWGLTRVVLTFGCACVTTLGLLFCTTRGRAVVMASLIVLLVIVIAVGSYAGPERVSVLLPANHLALAAFVALALDLYRRAQARPLS